MRKRAAMFTMAIMVLILTGCGETTPSATAPPRPSDIQSACEQVVLDFTGGEPVAFEKVASRGKQIFVSESGFIGDYIFSDKRYYYMVNPREFFLSGVAAVSEEVRDQMDIEGTQADTGEAAENLAVEIFQRAMSSFLIEGGELAAEGALTGETEYAVKVEEKVSDIFTGTYARIHLSKAGYLLDAEFTMGDYEKTNELIGKRNWMISEEEAKQAALEEAISMAAELSAENIRIEESKPCGIKALEDTAAWSVWFRYSKRGDDTYSGIVMVDAYSGEVLRVYFCA